MEWYTLDVNPNYEITKTGLVRNKATQHVLSQQERNGYLRVELSCDKTRKTYSVHRLVAEQFIPNPENKAEVNHKNFDRKDNRVENLEWVTRQENSDHKISSRGDALRNIMINNALNAAEANKKAVNQYDIAGNFISTYSSMSDAERVTGVNRKSIRFCIRGQRKTAGGFIWKLKESSTTIENKL